LVNPRPPSNTNEAQKMLLIRVRSEQTRPDTFLLLSKRTGQLHILKQVLRREGMAMRIRYLGKLSAGCPQECKNMPDEASTAFREMSLIPIHPRVDPQQILWEGVWRRGHSANSSIYLVDPTWLNGWITVPGRKFSMGNPQRACIGCAIASRPEDG